MADLACMRNAPVDQLDDWEGRPMWHRPLGPLAAIGGVPLHAGLSAWAGFLAVARSRRAAWIASPERQREDVALAARRVTLQRTPSISALNQRGRGVATHSGKFMTNPRSRCQLKRVLFVLLTIAGAIGCALWDIHVVGSAIAAGARAAAAGGGVPLASASRSPMRASAPVPATRALAGLRR